MLKYNYVIIGSDQFYSVAYHDVMNMPNVSYHSSIHDGFDSWFSRFLFKCNFYTKINRFIKNPLSFYVWPRIYPHSFNDDKPICYLFFANHDILKSTYIDYIRKTQPSAKCVLFFQDLIKTNKGLDIEYFKSKMDLVLSYDQGDSEKYNLHYHPTPMSYVKVEDNPNIQESDIYFCGYAKSRWKRVHECYSLLSSQGIKCDFNLINMPEDAERIDGINYGTKPFSYIKNLQHIIKTKCILEIMQEGADGFTPRLWESIIYDKHLLTNNKYVQFSDFNTSTAILDVREIINTEISQWIYSKVFYDETIKKSLSPVNLLQYIDNKL